MLRLDTKQYNKRRAVECSDKDHGLAWLGLQKAASGPWFGALAMETQLLPDLQVSGAVASMTPTTESGVVS